MTSSPQAEPIVSNEPGSFPWGVLTKRHPQLIETVRRQLPYPPATQEALDSLLRTLDRAVPPLEPGACDHQKWQDWSAPYLGMRWVDAPFLWAESYFYRLLLCATDYFESGPWSGVDPFAPQKNAELETPELSRDLGALDRLVEAPGEVGLSAALSAALWGNRADLGFRISDPSAQERQQVEDLVADDSSLVPPLLDSRPAGQVHLIADNAGRELVADLVLIDRLLVTGRAAEVTLHLKPYPYYVSDATTQDLLMVLRRMHAAGGAADDIATRLAANIRDGQLRVQTHGFWCSPLTFHDLPGDLTAELASARLVIIKGDLNYRRLVGDAHWAPTTAFTDLTSYFPAPLLALRTLKSDVAVGVNSERLARLESSAPGWRTDGTHAVIHARP
ncbi:damage-control phosphatase ARMT1 family protein [Luteipulveratus mongoliensis]|uniref:Damage-control phosphatase ARMT1-like metal-binding domain-containing protein n=1 Tax=Luteipulveratus mongoliensis TaxID=571913 RepID=A0A0K1JEJ7_9MICO|nr:damage-control phosphatase ARMT1 family protein [Luteipulveratus mongoliensis]AKU15137.1 hypothetical protein VV02_03425 [Luteipulveratus mongoliensis]